MKNEEMRSKYTYYISLIDYSYSDKYICIFIFPLTFLRERSKIIKFESWISLTFLAITHSISHSAFYRMGAQKDAINWMT